ncbi:MAG TPA: MaoC family dehydratase [Ramlibacter sp.]|nr:MaoC family dehydratase [Ramlibacter sp.]
MSQIKYYWEDMAAGSVRDLGTVTLSAQEIKDFARQFDPQPFHVDEEAAKHSIFGALCASGWHTCALAMKLTVENFLLEAASMGSPGLESLRWLKPVYPGDTLRLDQSVVESRALRSRPEIGLVRSRWEMFNQNGEKVMQMEGYGMFRRRHRATEQELAQLDASRE